MLYEKLVFLVITYLECIVDGGHQQSRLSRDPYVVKAVHHCEGSQEGRLGVGRLAEDQVLKS